MMEVKITKGYGKEKSVEEQPRYLEWLKKALLACDLPVESIRSERPTGGPITIELVDCYDDRHIIRAFLLLTTAQAKRACDESGESMMVSLDVILPGYSKPMVVIGTGY